MAIGGPIVDNTSDYIKRFPTQGLVSLFPTLLQPKSRGSVRLHTTNPYDTPKIDFGYFSDAADYPIARKAIRLALKCGSEMRASGFPIIEPHLVPSDPDDDECLDAFIREKLRTIYHYASTCRMGREQGEEQGVVGDELRVHGVLNLRVADASVFPNVLATHMQAPTVMVAERCADFIKRDWVEK
jgi:choline dehydrogenase-like flavoprotein